MSVGLRSIVTVQIANAGGSTTRGLTYSTGCARFTGTQQEPFDRTRLATVRRLVLGPKGSVSPIVCSFGLPKLRQILSERRTVYGWGRINYRDTNNPAAVHRPEFCYSLYDFGANQHGPGVAFQADHCERNNCTDEECDEQGRRTPTPFRRHPNAL